MAKLELSGNLKRQDIINKFLSNYLQDSNSTTDDDIYWIYKFLSCLDCGSTIINYLDLKSNIINYFCYDFEKNNKENFLKDINTLREENKIIIFYHTKEGINYFKDKKIIDIELKTIFKEKIKTQDLIDYFLFNYLQDKTNLTTVDDLFWIYRFLAFLNGDCIHIYYINVKDRKKDFFIYNFKGKYKRDFLRDIEEFKKNNESIIFLKESDEYMIKELENLTEPFTFVDPLVTKVYYPKNYIIKEN